MSPSRRRRLVTLAALSGLAVVTEASAGDPYLRWRTLETPHFRVSYHHGLEPHAERTAELAEAIHARLSPVLGWAPHERTEILLTDDTDSANGSATALPYDAVRMYVTAPDDMSTLGDYDDWLSALLTHEYTHILQLDNVSGLPALVNRLMGKRWAPNQVQPRWLVEGLAVAMETEHTSGGRLRSSLFDMYLRADVLSGTLARLDQLSHPTRRWPGGHLWYLYGGFFIDFIAKQYGPSTFAAVAADYGARPVPWGINRSIQRVTGKTYPELYEAWRASLEQRYGEQRRQVEARGRREGRRLTHAGRTVAAPRFVPRCARTSAAEELLYFKDDGEQPPGLYQVRLEAEGRAREEEQRHVAWSAGRTASFDGDCGLVFDSVAPSRRRYFFSDLFRLPHGETATAGNEKVKQRLTTGRRAREPDVSADGRALVFVTNRAGTTSLELASFGPDGALGPTRRLVHSRRWEQIYTPRFSPDGRWVAYSAWTRGGYRDLYVVEVESGAVQRLTHDRAIDQQPSWSPDGQRLYFTSDRTGIANVYALELRSGVLAQVTNVLTGAYQPEVSPDGRTLVYVGYGSQGFDLYSLALEPARWLEPLPAQDRRPPPPPEPRPRQWQSREYSAWDTLRPHAYALDLTTGPYGDTLYVSTAGADLVGLHGFGAVLGVDFDQAEPQASLGYSYRRLPFTLNLSASRSAAPRRSYRYGTQTPLVTERFTGVTSGAQLYLPGDAEGQALTLRYTFGAYDTRLPVGALDDPAAPVPREPHRGTLGALRLGWSYSNASGTLGGVSTERGLSTSVDLDVADPAFGGQDTLFAIGAAARGYLPLPALPHHVLALGVSGATAAGSYPRRGLYVTGGYSPTPTVLEAYTDGLTQGSFVLRGYAPAQFIGQTYGLLNLEYRFPLLYADRGLSTLPAFLRTLSGALFLDYGGAFDLLDHDDPWRPFHAGVGGELWVDLVLGYFVGANLRLGMARGLDAQAPGLQGYFVAAAPF